MQLTRAADYAVRVMIHLAGLPSGSRASRENLAQMGQIPIHFLGKILQSLTRAGLIASHRGATGGFSLLRRADELTLLDVIEAIEGPLWLNQCVDPSQPCARQGWCEAHRLWVEAQEAMVKVLRSACLTDLARDSAANRALQEKSLCALGGRPLWS